MILGDVNIYHVNVDNLRMLVQQLDWWCNLLARRLIYENIPSFFWKNYRAVLDLGLKSFFMF